MSLLNSGETHAAFCFGRTVGEFSGKRTKDNVKVLQAVQGEAEECCWCLTFLPPSLLSPPLSLLHTSAHTQVHTHTQTLLMITEDSVAFPERCAERSIQFWPIWSSRLLFTGHRRGLSTCHSRIRNVQSNPFVVTVSFHKSIGHCSTEPGSIQMNFYFFWATFSWRLICCLC